MKFLTFLNSGCIEICKNMLESAKRVGIDQDDFYIGCIDEKAYEEMKLFKNAFLYDNQEVTEYQNWSFDSDSNFRKVVKKKWGVIKKIYDEHKNLCWVDTDIVFVKDPRPLLENNKKILFQTDQPGSYLCSGFMVFNDTKQCSDMIDECAGYTEEDDQLLINHIAMKTYKEDVDILDQHLFPNGNTYYKLGIKDKAYIVHNNWMIGVDTKINKFKEENLWYI